MATPSKADGYNSRELRSEIGMALTKISTAAKRLQERAMQLEMPTEDRVYFITMLADIVNEANAGLHARSELDLLLARAKELTQDILE